VGAHTADQPGSHQTVQVTAQIDGPAVTAALQPVQLPGRQQPVLVQQIQGAGRGLRR